jgi:uncharacterized protein
VTEKPPRTQDEDPRPVEEWAQLAEVSPERNDDRPEPAAAGGPSQPSPWQGVYGQPPGMAPSSYDPRWGYGPPGNPEHSQRVQPTGDDTTMALFCYVGALLGGFIVPLILYVSKKNESQFVRFHAAQALNYTLTQMIVTVSAVVPVAVAAVAFRQPAIVAIAAPIWLYELISPYVWLILAAIRGNRGEWYTLPKWTCFRMVR